MNDAEKAEMYRKQLGGVSAALNRERGKSKRLQARVAELEELLDGARDGLDPREYVVGTFEPCDVEERVEPAVLDYIRDKGIMDEIILCAVKYLRDAYDWDFGDTVCECLRSALIDEIGREKLEELES